MSEVDVIKVGIEEPLTAGDNEAVLSSRLKEKIFKMPRTRDGEQKSLDHG
jgi:hypothetical protein